MRNLFEKLKGSGLLILITMLLCSAFGVMDAGAMCADATPLIPSGIAEQGGEGETVQFANENVDEFIRKSLDPVLLKLEPYNNFLDSIGRQIKTTKHIKSQVYEYYTQGYLPSEVELSAAVAADINQTAINTSDNLAIAINETLIVEGVPGYLPGTSTTDPLRDLVLVVVDRDSSGKPICRAVNGKGTNNLIPAIALPGAGSDPILIARSTRAASEKQIRTDVFTSLPQKTYQYLQKAIAEVEMSTFFEMAEKEIKFNFSDATERTLIEYRREVTNGYWRGVKAKLQIANKYRDKAEDTYFSEGIWNGSTAEDFNFNGVLPTANTLIDLFERSFSAPSSSDTKILCCSTPVLTALQKVQWNSNIYLGDRVEFMNFKMTRLISNFGEFLIFHSKDMNECGLRGKAFILDPNYLVKVTMGWRSINIDNVKNGDADSKSLILTEPSALILKNPEAHLRVHLA
jgi:hypothetical protein